MFIRNVVKEFLYLYDLNCYQFIFNNTENKRGDATCVYVNNTLNYSLRTDLSMITKIIRKYFHRIVE